MHLQHPWVLTLLAFLPLLWLARPRRPSVRVVVGDTFLWPSMPRSAVAPERWRFSHDLLTWLRTGILSALVFALAGPSIDRVPAHIAIVVDGSLSMGTRGSDGRTRFDQAREQARAILDRQRSALPVDLWLVAGAPRLVARGGRDAIVSALSDLAPTDAWADVDAAVSTIAQTAPQRIYVLSDATVPVHEDGVEWLAVGTPAENAAVLDLVLTGGAEGRGRVTATTRVANFSAQSRNASLEFRAGSRLLGRRNLTLGPRDVVTMSTALDVASNEEAVSVRLDADDALAADNVREALIARAPRVRVTLEGRSTFVSAALDADPAVERVTSRQRGDVRVCAPCVGEPDDSALILLTEGDRSALAPVMGIAPDHPVAAGVPLDGTTIHPRAFRSEPGDSRLALAGDRPVVVARERGASRRVFLAFDAEDPQLARQPALPLLVSNAIAWLGGADRRPAAVRAGDIFTWTPRLDRGVAIDRSDARGPGGGPVPVALTRDAATIADTWRAGLYTVSLGAQQVRFVSTPAAREESDVSAPLPASTLQDGSARASVTAPSAFDLSPVLLVAALLCLLLETGVGWARGQLTARSRRSLWARAAIAVLLVAAVVGMPIPTGRMPIALALVVDRSDSLAPWARHVEASAASVTAALENRDAVGLTSFGRTAQVVQRVEPGRRTPFSATAEVDGSGSDIAAGLRAARASLPAEGDRRLLLFSDGLATTGDALAEARRAAADGIRLDAWTPPDDVARLAAVRRVTAPSLVRQGESFVVKVLVEGAPGTTGTVRVVGGEVPVELPLSISASSQIASIEVPMQASVPGLLSYRASFRPDATGDNPTFDALTVEHGAAVAVAGRARLLVVGSPGLAAQPFPTDVFDVRAVSLSAFAAAQLDEVDAVVLDDVDLGSLSTVVRTRLVHFVEQGGGLLVLASERSLPAGSTGDAAFDSLLAVDPRPRAGVRGSSLGLVVVFDKSGSMDDRVGGARKIEFARRAVRDVADALSDGDALGVVAFDAAPTTIQALGPRPPLDRLDGALRAVEPSGPTAVAPALERALQALNGPVGRSTKRRHALLVTDGQTSQDDVAALRRSVSSTDVPLSIVAVGAGSERVALTAIAEGTGGRAYFPEDVRDLPATLARETARVAGGRSVETPFEARVVPHALTGGMRGSPRFGGYVVSSAKPMADVLLASSLGDPLIAIGRLGAGRVATYTADLHGPWSAGLNRWPDAATLFTRVARWLARHVDDPEVTMRVHAVSDGLRLEVDGARTDAGVTMRGTARTAGGEPVDFLLQPMTSDRFQAFVPLARPGAYQVTIEWSGPATPSRTMTRGVFWTAPNELDARSPDRAYLEELAAATGGRVLGPDEDPVGPRRQGLRDGRPWMGGLALALFLFEMVGFALIGRLAVFGRRTTRPLKEQHA